MNNEAFRPSGALSYEIDVTDVASTAIQCSPDPGMPTISGYLVSNASTTPVWIAFGLNSAIAAVIPTSGTPANGIWLGGNSSQTFTFKAGAWISVIAASGQTSTVYITPGTGL